MKILLASFVILIIAVTTGLLAYEDPGYVLFGRGTTTVEMSLSLFVLLQLVGFGLLYGLIRFIQSSLHVPSQLQHWRQRRRLQRAQAASRRGLIELAEGHWQKAEHALIKSARDSETPLLNYLSAARAAQKQNAHERRDNYLAMAASSMPDADIAVELTQAELQLAHGQLEQALATLEHLRQIAPRHSHVQLLLSMLYQKLQHWEDLRDLLPQLRKHKILDEKALHTLSLQTYHALLDQIARQDDADKAKRLHDFWQSVPRDLRHDTDLLADYARQLMAIDEHDRVESLLREALKRHWEPKWVELYGQVQGSTPEKQLETAEAWLKGRETNAVLLLCLGRIALRNQLWGKARAYLESSLGNQPRAETYRELGMLLEQLGEKEEAAENFRKGLLLATRQTQPPVIENRPLKLLKG